MATLEVGRLRLEAWLAVQPSGTIALFWAMKWKGEKLRTSSLCSLSWDGCQDVLETSAREQVCPRSQGRLPY